MKASQEFVVGKHRIGYVETRFTEHFKEREFEMQPMPIFQKLPRRMNDAEIEGELKCGFSSLGDILSFLDNAPEECKDGNWNLFYTPAFVVSVGWSGFGGGWGVSAWSRYDGRWGAGSRVFSPAIESSNTKSSDLGSFVPRKEFDEFVKKVYAVLKI